MQNEICCFLIYDHIAIRMSSVNSIEVNDTFILINNTTLILPMTLTTEQREIVLKRSKIERRKF